MKRIVIVLSLIASCGTFVFAQMARKPSPSREPQGAMSKKPDSKARSLAKIGSREEFDSVARTYHQGTPYALPHVMFVIDRQNKNKIYYVNSQKYRFHKDFLIANYLVLKGDDFFKAVYIAPNRRFIVGTIAYQNPVEKFTFEFWDGDLIPADQIKLTNDIISKTFFDEVYFKPNSIRQDELTADMPIARVTSDDISKNQEYLALNAATGIGRIHVIDKLDDTVEIGYNEILVLSEVPISLPPVAGIIIAKPSTPLSHINILSKGWGIPNVYIKDADKLFKDLDGKWIKFEANLTDYSFEPADKRILDDYDQKQRELGKIIKAPPSNLEVAQSETLKRLKAGDSVIYGAKAANLGEVANARIPNVIVPDGFALPFSYYDDYMKHNDLYKIIDEFMFDNEFVHNPRRRRQKLEEFRASIRHGEFDEEISKEIVAKWRALLGGKGVFVRSSSNAEDLPNFSGAGLYTTVKNVKEADQIIDAVKTVWASLWNFEAYEARERNFVEHRGTYMGVLIQIGVDMDNGGVMITKDPFDAENKGAVYIAAVWGHNVQVVGEEDSGRKQTIPEQILFSPKSNAVQVLTRSNQETVMQFDAAGGLRETPVSTKRRILGDPVARRLVSAALRIKKAFGNKKDQDIEWGYKRGQIFILQTRPYIN